MQRVSRAAVMVDGAVVGAVDRGLLVLVGVARTDGDADAKAPAAKIAGLRIFPDADGLMNRSVADVGGEVLVVSQFTLYGDVRRGRRPSFSVAAPPEQAAPLVREAVSAFERFGLRVSTGVFGAMMEVSLVNDGPVTILIDVLDGRVV